MAKGDVVRGYAAQSELSHPETAALDRLAGEARGLPILDLGVGGGRTVSALRAISEDYVGVELSPQMVAACRQRYPEATIELGDARDLGRFVEGHFQLVVFSCNGIGMVDHEARVRILAEVRRVLRPGGAFVFSTHNRRCPDHDAGFRFPALELSWNPLRLLVRSARFASRTVARMRNRRRHLPEERRLADYSVINDVCHDYGTLLYYIDLAAQRRQLADAGYRPDSIAFDLAGREIADDTRDSSILYVARK